MSSVMPVTFNQGVDRSSTLDSYIELPMLSHGNPFEQARDKRIPRTATVPARLAYHEAHAALRPLLAGVQTAEDLDNLVDQLNEIRQAIMIFLLIFYTHLSETSECGETLQSSERLHDPAMIKHKGRPCTKRLTAAREGPSQGGGARKGRHTDAEGSGRKCGACRIPGHTRARCPKLLGEWSE